MEMMQDAIAAAVEMQKEEDLKAIPTEELVKEILQRGGLDILLRCNGNNDYSVYFTVPREEK
ncbi:MAG: hypothetical protein ACRC3H_23750 [Lachnospiraceae bacterium]